MDIKIIHCLWRGLQARNNSKSSHKSYFDASTKKVMLNLAHGILSHGVYVAQRIQNEKFRFFNIG